MFLQEKKDLTETLSDPIMRKYIYREMPVIVIGCSSLLILGALIAQILGGS